MNIARGASWPSVNGYRISAEIGRGGSASVYEAVQESVGRRVALKVLSAASTGPDMEGQFSSECRTIGELSWHPHVVALFDAGLTDDGRPYMAMEFLPHGSLAEQVKDKGALSANEATRVGIEIADALSAAHDAGVIHRDVKPANILIGRRGEHLLGDFGIATIIDSTQSAIGSFSGTYAYCAPEIHQGHRASPASDVFSLGASLYMLLTGHSAFMSCTDDAPSAVILRVVSEPSPPLPRWVPPPLVDAIERAMAKNPADRQQSAADFGDALREFGANETYSTVVRAKLPLQQSSELPPPGWHPDPTGAAVWRWWDGTGWAGWADPAELPPPGWYPDPTGAAVWQWWDGTSWADPAELPPPGWHPDPTGAAVWRWWDGTSWADPAELPPPGWYPDPTGAAVWQWWDGTSWADPG